MASAFDMLGSIDCNAGQPYLGWDTDELPSDPRKALLSMMIVVNQGGIAPGGNNFDCKLRRESTDLEDMFVAHFGRKIEAGTTTFEEVAEYAKKCGEPKQISGKQ